MKASDFLVAVDDGHGQDSRAVGRFDPGAIGNRRREADVAYLIGEKMRLEFRRRGCKTMKPTGLYTTRAAQADKAGAHLLISNHLNAHTTTTANGTETFAHTVASARSVRLAGTVNTAIVKRLKTTNRGVKRNGFSVLSGKSPAILIEWVFITNKEDLVKLDANLDTAIVDVVDVVMEEYDIVLQGPTPVPPPPKEEDVAAKNVLIQAFVRPEKAAAAVKALKDLGFRAYRVDVDEARITRENPSGTPQ